MGNADLTKTKKSKLSPMAENYTMGAGRKSGEANPEHGSVDGMSDMDSDIVEGAGKGTVHSQSDVTKQGGKLPGIGK